MEGGLRVGGGVLRGGGGGVKRGGWRRGVFSVCVEREGWGGGVIERGRVTVPKSEAGPSVLWG